MRGYLMTADQYVRGPTMTPPATVWLTATQTALLRFLLPVATTNHPGREDLEAKALV